MSFAELKGANLIKMVQDRLGGYANGIDNEVILDVINEGKDEVWTILKSLSENYFTASTRFDDTTKTNYFGPLSSTQREYTLPQDFRAMRFIECVTPGFEYVTFVKRGMSTPEFKDARRSANQTKNNNGVQMYVYDIAEAVSGSTTEDGGTAGSGFEIVLAQFPQQTLQLVVWYLRALPDLEADTTLDQIILPYSKKIANFAVEKCMKILQDIDMDDLWMKSWRNDVITIAQSGGQVNQADPVFVADFEG